jgi:hypothetical protein
MAGECDARDTVPSAEVKKKREGDKQKGKGKAVSEQVVSVSSRT